MPERTFSRDIDNLGELYRFAEDAMLAESIDDSVRFPIQPALEELFVNLHLIQHMVDTLEYDHRDGRSRIRFSKEPEASDV